MGYTQYGEFIRVQRIKNHEVMGDLAAVLNTNTPFISAVENGKKNVPEDWIPKIINHYNLNEAEQEELKIAIENSKTQAKIMLTKASVAKREAALKFARSFENMDEETASRIMKILEGGDA